jgi:hypothetical protein
VAGIDRQTLFCVYVNHKMGETEMTKVVKFRSGRPVDLPLCEL